MKALKITSIQERREHRELEERARVIVQARIRDKALELSQISRGTRAEWRDFWADAYGWYTTQTMRGGGIPVMGVAMPESSDEDLLPWGTKPDRLK